MCNKGPFDPVNQSRKSQLERAYTKEWKTNMFWEHLVPPFQQHLRLCCSQPACPGYSQSCRAVLLHQPWPYLSIWDHGILSLTVLYITSPCPLWPLHWSPSKSVDIIFNSIMCYLVVWDTNIYARALKLGQLLLLSIKDKLNLKLSLPSRQNTSYPWTLEHRFEAKLE